MVAASCSAPAGSWSFGWRVASLNPKSSLLHTHPPTHTHAEHTHLADTLHRSTHTHAAHHSATPTPLSALKSSQSLRDGPPCATHPRRHLSRLRFHHAPWDTAGPGAAAKAPVTRWLFPHSGTSDPGQCGATKPCVDTVETFRGGLDEGGLSVISENVKSTMIIFSLIPYLLLDAERVFF